MTTVEPAYEDHMAAAKEERFVAPPSNEDGIDIPREDLPAANADAEMEAAGEPAVCSYDDDCSPPVADGGVDRPCERDEEEQPAKQEVILRSPVLALQTQVASRPSAHAPTPTTTTQQHDHQRNGETATSKSHAVPYEGNGVVHTKRIKKTVKRSAAAQHAAIAAEAELKHSAEREHDTAAAAAAAPAKKKTVVKKVKHEDPQPDRGNGAEAVSKKKKVKKTPHDGAAGDGPAKKVKLPEAPVGDKKLTHKKKAIKKATETAGGASATEAVKVKSSPKKKPLAAKLKKGPLVAEGETEQKAAKKPKRAPKKAAENEPVAVVVEETTTIVVVAATPAEEREADEPVPREDHPEAEPATKTTAEVAPKKEESDEHRLAADVPPEPSSTAAEDVAVEDAPRC